MTATPGSASIAATHHPAPSTTTAYHKRTTANPLLDLFLRTNDANDGVPRLDSSIWEFLTVRDLCRLRSCSRTIYDALELVEYNRCRDGRGEKAIVYTHRRCHYSLVGVLFILYQKLRIRLVMSSHHPILSCGNKIISCHFQDIPACSRRSPTRRPDRVRCTHPFIAPPFFLFFVLQMHAPGKGAYYLGTSFTWPKLCIFHLAFSTTRLKLHSSMNAPSHNRSIRSVRPPTRVLEGDASGGK
jgi:hypothetical protein